MPSGEFHKQQAGRNSVFLSEIVDKLKARDNYPEWCVTVQFYTALHVVEAIFAKDNIHHTNHTPRNDAVYAHPSLFDKSFAGHYNNLYNACYKARYLNKKGDSISILELPDCDKSMDYIKNFAKEKHKISI